MSLHTTILPIGGSESLFDPVAFERILNNALDETAKAIKIDYGVTTQTWKHKPKFAIRKSGKWERIISTTDKIYGYVSEGTRPHTIRPKNAPALAFQANYKAKTIVRQVRSRQGGPSGPMVYAQEVQHPGFPGREFNKVISEKWRKEWPTQLGRAIATEFFK